MQRVLRIIDAVFVFTDILKEVKERNVIINQYIAVQHLQIVVSHYYNIIYNLYNIFIRRINYRM